MRIRRLGKVGKWDKKKGRKIRNMGENGGKQREIKRGGRYWDGNSRKKCSRVGGKRPKRETNGVENRRRGGDAVSGSH